jgi:hypothetical protein
MPFYESGDVRPTDIITYRAIDAIEESTMNQIRAATGRFSR